MNNFAKLLIVFVLVGGCAGTLYATKAVMDNTKENTETRQIIAENAEAQTVEERMMQEQADLAKAAFSALVAQSVSHDRAVESIVRSNSNEKLYIMIAVVALVVFYIYRQTEKAAKKE